MATAVTKDSSATTNAHNPYGNNNKKQMRQAPAPATFLVRVRKCHNVSFLSVADVERLRNVAFAGGIPIDVIGCWPQHVGTKKTGAFKKFDWSSMILHIRILPALNNAANTPASIVQQLRDFDLFCSFDVSTKLQFDVWEQTGDINEFVAESTAKMREQGAEPPKLIERLALPVATATVAAATVKKTSTTNSPSVTYQEVGASSAASSRRQTPRNSATSTPASLKFENSSCGASRGSASCSDAEEDFVWESRRVIPVNRGRRSGKAHKL